MRIITPFNFQDICTLVTRNAYLQKYRNNRISEKVAFFFKKIHNLRVNNSRILKI